MKSIKKITCAFKILTNSVKSYELDFSEVFRPILGVSFQTLRCTQLLLEYPKGGDHIFGIQLPMVAAG